MGSLAPWAPAATASGVSSHPFTACFAPRDRACLPEELQRPVADPGPLPVVGAGGVVEIRWSARESFGLHGYRLTAWVEDGVLSGLAARWELAPGSGERERSGDPHEYRVRIDLPALSAAHVRAVLEAVRLDGSPVLLAVRDVRTLPRPLADTLSGPRFNARLRGIGPPGLAPHAWLALPAGVSLETLPPSLQFRRPRPLERRQDARGVAWQRGPPPASA